MSVFRRRVSRRQILRGSGAVISLPLLEAMTSVSASGDQPPVASKRIAVVYVPNGIEMKDWTPEKTGSDFESTRILKPLEPFRNDLTVVSGLVNNAPEMVQGGAHAKASGSFLSGAAPKFTDGPDVRAGVTFDQVAAATWASETRIASLQLGCEDSRMAGNCDTGSSCAYTNCLSWKDAETPLMVEINPRAVFERLFGSADPSLTPKERAVRLRYRRSILDATREQVDQLNRIVSGGDRKRMDQYLTAIRDIEHQIEAAEGESQIPPVQKPAGIPVSYSEYVRLMFDLQIVAFQSDVCRVTTMMLGREGSVRTYPEIGVPDPHHPLTHHRGHPDFIEKVTQINCFHASLFASFLQKLDATKDAFGRRLMDDSVILYGGGISDGNSHSRENLPVIVAGNAGGCRGGNHLKCEPQPVTNLFVDLLSQAGVEIESFGDSTGRLNCRSCG